MFISIPEEQTTAATDAILSATAFLVSVLVFRAGKDSDRKKAVTWTLAFGLLGLAAFFGVMAHGLQVSEQTRFLLWQPLNLSLGFMMAMILAGVARDLRGDRLPRLLLPIALFFALVFFAVTLLIPRAFIVFVLYESVTMLFALSAYLYLAVKRRMQGAVFMFLGIFVSILASVIQTIESVRITVFWVFDHNGLFHLVQVAGVVLIFLGLRRDFSSRR